MITQSEIKMIHANKLSKAGSFFLIGVLVMVATWWITKELWLYPIIFVCLGLQFLFHGTSLVMYSQIRKEVEDSEDD